MTEHQDDKTEEAPDGKPNQVPVVKSEEGAMPKRGPVLHCFTFWMQAIDSGSATKEDFQAHWEWLKNQPPES